MLIIYNKGKLNYGKNKKELKDELLSKVNGGSAMGRLLNSNRMRVLNWIANNIDEISRRINIKATYIETELLAYIVNNNCDNIVIVKKYVYEKYSVSIDDIE